MNIYEFNIITPLVTPMTITEGIHTIPIMTPIYYTMVDDNELLYTSVKANIISIMLEVKILSIKSYDTGEVGILIARPDDSTISLTWDDQTRHFLHDFVRLGGVNGVVYKSHNLGASDYARERNLWLKKLLYYQLSGSVGRSINLDIGLIDGKLMNGVSSALDHLTRCSNDCDLIYQFQYQDGKVMYFGYPKYTLPTWDELN